MKTTITAASQVGNRPKTWGQIKIPCLIKGLSSGNAYILVGGNTSSERRLVNLTTSAVDNVRASDAFNNGSSYSILTTDQVVTLVNDPANLEAYSQSC